MSALAIDYRPTLQHPDPSDIGAGHIGDGGVGELVAYTGTDPNSDGVKPINLAGPAIAVKPNSTTYTWDAVNQNWS